jgi:uncharacterized membrane protein
MDTDAFGMLIIFFITNVVIGVVSTWRARGLRKEVWTYKDNLYAVGLILASWFLVWHPYFDRWSRKAEKKPDAE